MGDIFVDIFLDTLKNLIINSNLDENHQLHSFVADIRFLRDFLKITEKKRNKNSQVMDLVIRIRDVVSQTENIVEQYVAHVFKDNHSPLEHHSHLSLDLDCFKEIKTLKAKAEQILLKHPPTGSECIGVLNSSRERSTYKVGEEKVVVGIEDDVNVLLGMLDDRENGGQLEIISILGIGGGGKTTLAREVYDHRRTCDRFQIRAWVTVSQDYNKTMKKDMLIGILESISKGKYEDYMKSSEDHLGEEVYKSLQGRKYLIVMDDIWDLQAWNDIQRSFPRQCKKSKVLLTSRLPVEPAGICYVPHEVGLLSPSHSWELLEKKVFKGKQCPPNLKNIGMQIVEKCKGLPLAIVTIAGILANKDEAYDAWKEVFKHLSSIIATNKEAGCMEILELSYNHLPLHLKACFLYIGAKPEDEEISVRELIWLWIAEGFVQQNSGGKRLEDIAHDYLTVLIERNLIMVAKKRSLGTIKACYIHDLLRELCLKKAKEENFFEQIYRNESSSPSATIHRRLFIDLQSFNKFSSSLCARKLRSFLCCSLTNNQEKENILSVEKFEFLRVLHFISGILVEIRKGDLVHLRYLAISLPTIQYHLASKFFSSLLNLETLILSFESTYFCLPHNIFNMVKLRHLYTRRGIFTYRHDSHVEGEGNTLDSLQTIQTMDLNEHCLRFLKRIPNLRKLRLSRDDALMLPDLEFLKRLEILSLYVRHMTAEVASTCLKLPLALTKLTLEKTRLKWEELSEILQTLRSLKVLKLLSGACRGGIWDTSKLEAEFSQLKYLRLEYLDIMEWSAYEGQFRGLEVLVINRCSWLKEIPFEFSDCNELREIKVEYSSPSAEKSAGVLLEELINNTGKDDCPKLFTIGNAPKVCHICRDGPPDRDDVEELPCSHIFHTECVGEWLKTSTVCPLCKSEIGDRGYS